MLSSRLSLSKEKETQKNSSVPKFGSTILSTDGFNISAYFGLNLK
jgi:hypothetical protein